MATKVPSKVEIPQKYKDGYVPMRITNAVVFWAHVHKPDTAFGNNKYSVEMHLEDHIADALRKEGFEIKEKYDKDGALVAKNVLKAKSDAINKKTGEKNKPPLVVGTDGRTPFTENIGNGSICNIIIDAKAWQVRGQWQLSAYLKSVQVVKHVPYTSGGFEDLSAEPSPF